MNSNYNRISECRLLSISYGLCCSLIGLTITTVEPFKGCTKCENYLKIVVDVYFIYLHLISIIWMITMFTFITIAKRNQNVFIKNFTGSFRQMVHPPTLPPDFTKWRHKLLFNSNKQNDDDDDSFEMIEMINNNDLNRTNDDITKATTTALLNINNDTTNNEEPSYHFVYDYNNGTGELYVRVGLALFCICSMIEGCIGLLRKFEVYNLNYKLVEACKVTFIIAIISKILSLIFIFMQSFFIFKYANILINYNKKFAIFGLMHLVCANFCVTVRTIIQETVSEINKEYSESPLRTLNQLNNNSSYLQESLINNTDSSEYSMNPLVCVHSTRYRDHIHDIQFRLVEFLYPCIIEYSLICMTVFFILWGSLWNLVIDENTTQDQLETISESDNNHSSLKDNCQIKYNNLTTGSVQNVLKLKKSISSDDLSSLHHFYSVNQFTVDCSKSTTGIFIGIFVLVLTILSLIIYFIYSGPYPDVAINISEITELSLVILSLFVVLQLFFVLNKFNYFSNSTTINVYHMSYNETLMIIGLSGIYVYSFYTIFAIVSDWTIQGIGSLTRAITLSMQVTNSLSFLFYSFII
jgi:hypothetical protein